MSDGDLVMQPPPPHTHTAMKVKHSRTCSIRGHLLSISKIKRSHCHIQLTRGVISARNDRITQYFQPRFNQSDFLLKHYFVLYLYEPCVILHYYFIAYCQTFCAKWLQTLVKITFTDFILLVQSFCQQMMK